MKDNNLMQVVQVKKHCVWFLAVFKTGWFKQARNFVQVFISNGKEGSMFRLPLLQNLVL